MELAKTCLIQILIMFILVAVGYLCGRIRMIDKQTNTKLSTFVLDVVNPVLIFNSYQKDFSAELLKGLGLSVLLSAGSYALILTVLRVIYRNDRSKDAVVARAAAIYSNCGFMGIPLINGLFGAEGVMYVTGYLTVFNLMVWTHGISLFSKGSEDGEGGADIGKILRSPSIIAIAVGLVCFRAQIRLPDIMAQACTHIANCNTPLAMICAGVTISFTDIGEHLKNKNVYIAVLLRLVVCPVLFWAVFRWLPLPETVYMTVLVASGCPAAATCTMFALKFGGNSEMSAVMFAATTVLSAITLPLVVMLGTV
ncbi:MAG: AEC family transporter [Oscillospiraceae bacterium]|nr:AEC family transporter [Oscillospiraceae bacterium]